MLNLKNKSKKRKYKLANVERRLITFSNSKSIISEQFRTIRANIKFSLPDKDVKMILVTSSIPGEGKSTNAANLAVVFAQEGKKVLIVDADMRKPTLHYIFGVFNTTGLSNVLSKQTETQFAIQETPIVDLYILPSGPTPPNPTELLYSERFNLLLEEIKNSFDMIIFDAPPLLSVSDAQVLSNKCDGTLLVVHSGISHKEDVLKAQDILNISKAKIMGAILNHYKMPKNKKYFYENYGVGR